MAWFNQFSGYLPSMTVKQNKNKNTLLQRHSRPHTHTHRYNIHYIVAHHRYKFICLSVSLSLSQSSTRDKRSASNVNVKWQTWWCVCVRVLCARTQHSLRGIIRIIKTATTITTTYIIIILIIIIRLHCMLHFYANMLREYIFFLFVCACVFHRKHACTKHIYIVIQTLTHARIRICKRQNKLTTNCNCIWFIFFCTQCSVKTNRRDKSN